MYKIINEYNKLSQLKKNVFSGSVYSGVNIIITLLAYPIYLKYLGAEKYGLWATVSVVLSFSQLGQLRIEAAIIKYVSYEYGHKAFNAIKEYISTALYFLLIPSAIVIVISAIFKSEFAEFLKLKKIFLEDGTRLVFYVGLLSVFSFYVNAIRAIVVAIGRIDIANYIFLLGRILQILLAVSLLMLGVGVWSLYYGFLLSFIMPFLVCIFIIEYKYKIRIFDPLAFKIERCKKLLKFGGVLIVGTIAQLFVVPFNKIIIARYIGLSEVSYYQIALQVVMATRNLFARGLESILPKISEIHGKLNESIKSIIIIRKKAIIFILLFAFPIFLLLFTLANPLLNIWLGNEFDIQIAITLRILLIGWFFNVLAVPDYYMFLGIGKVGTSVSATCLKSMTNILLILGLLVLSIHLTLSKVVLVDSISLVMAVLFLKYKYLNYSRLELTI